MREAWEEEEREREDTFLEECRTSSQKRSNIKERNLLRESPLHPKINNDRRQDRIITRSSGACGTPRDLIPPTQSGDTSSEILRDDTEDRGRDNSEEISDSILNSQASEEFFPPNQLTMSNSEMERVPPEVHDPDSPEANGGNTFKVTTQSPNITINQFEDILKHQMSTITTEISTAVSQVKDNSRAIKENQEEIRSLRQDIAELKEVNSSSRVRDAVHSIIKADRGLQSPSTTLRPTFLAGARCAEQEKARIKKYNNSRRSIRVWPIAGKTNDDISANLKTFLVSTLQMAPEDVVCLGIQWIDRIRSAPRARIKEEIRITFTNQYLRDEFASKGRLLSGEVDEEGKPTAGLRMDIPDFLAADFKTLSDYGFRMKNAHGKETRKYIKYEDDSYGLFLELKLPHSNSFIKLTPDLARSLSDEGDRDEVNRLRKDLTAKFVPPRFTTAPTTSANLQPIQAPRAARQGRTLGTITASLQNIASPDRDEATNDGATTEISTDWTSPPPNSF